MNTTHGDDMKELTTCRNVWRFMEGKTYWGGVFEVFIGLLIILTIVLSMLMTVKSICDIPTTSLDPDDSCPHYFKTIDLIAVIIFTVEYFLRMYAAPEDPMFASYNGRAIASLAYMFTFYAI